MSNLTSTVPGAFNALYNLLATAGNGQSPSIPVFHSEVMRDQQLQNGYVLLEQVENHRMTPAALGSYAFYETYDFCGCVVFYQGGPDLVTMAETVLSQTWSIYQNVVVTTVINNAGVPAYGGGPVLGSAAPAALEVIVPAVAAYTGGPGQMEGGASGFIGEVSFRYSLKARITVP